MNVTCVANKPLTPFEAPTILGAKSMHRSRFLDGLRGFAAIYVALHHAYCTIWPPFAAIGPDQPMSRPAGTAYYITFPLFFGGSAVAIFIAISGFSLSIPLIGVAKFDTIKFYLRRIWRIAPPYFAGLMLSMLLISLIIGNKTGSHWDLFISYSYFDVLTHFTFIQNLFPFSAQTINGAYWSIAVEMQFYLIYPLILICFRRNFIFGCVLASTLVAAVRLNAHFNPSTPISAQLFTLFCIGILAAATAYSRDPAAAWLRKGVHFDILGLASIISGFIVACLSQKYNPSELLIVGGLVCWMIEDAKGGPRHRTLALFDNAVMARFGLFAYSIYLTHEPIQQVIWQYGIRQITDNKLVQLGLLAVGTFALVIPVAYLFFICCEAPFMRFATFDRLYSYLRISRSSRRSPSALEGEA